MSDSSETNRIKGIRKEFELIEVEIPHGSEAELAKGSMTGIPTFLISAIDQFMVCHGVDDEDLESLGSEIERDMPRGEIDAVEE
jgi:hypothetical protein